MYKKAKLVFSKESIIKTFYKNQVVVYMIKHQAKLKKIFDQKISSTKTRLAEHQCGLNFFINTNWIFIVKKVKKKNSNIKKSYKNLFNKFNNLLKTLVVVYITLIRKKDFKNYAFYQKII